jgi:lysophospholipase L1-like esterase
MKYFSYLLLLVSVSAGAIEAQSDAVQTDNPTKTTAARAPDPSFAPIKEVAGLPRVLIIGDSISMGYTLPVRKNLEGKANILRIPENGGPSSRGIDKLTKWLGEKKWDLIIFNFGLHDLRVMDEGKHQVEIADYEKNLTTIGQALLKTGAKVIFINTTPVPKVAMKVVRLDTDVVIYNASANKVMKALKIPVHDLNAAVTPKIKDYQKPNDVHYLPEGYQFIGQVISAEIAKSLKK